MSSKEYKIMFLGSGGAGKTAIIERFVKDTFLADDNPTIEETYRKEIEVDGKQCLLNILDVSGLEEFSKSREIYMTTVQSFVLTYSVASRSSFIEANNLHEQVLRLKETKDVPIVLVGNKCDLESYREVTTEQGEELARKLNCPFLETSAKENIRIEDVFVEIVRRTDAHHLSGAPVEESKKRSKFLKFFKRE